MHVQNQPQQKPQPIKVSLETPVDQVYKLAEHLYSDHAAQHRFQESPEELLREFGLRLNDPLAYFAADKVDKPGGKPDDLPQQGDEGEEEALALCVVVATPAAIAAIAVCAVVAVIEEEPIDTLQ